MKRTALVAGLGIAALLGGSLALVFLLTSRASTKGPPSAPPIAVAPAQGAGSAAPPAAPAPPPPPRGGTGPSRAWWEAPRGDPSAAPMAGRVIRRSVHKALLARPVQSRLARCVHRDGGFGGGASPGRIPRARPAVLMLEMEGTGREVRIVEARVQAYGEASADVVSCAQGVLRGQVVRVSSGGSGRMRMSFSLNPRTETLAATR